MLVRPEFKAMFLDDLLNGSRKQLSAPLADIVVFARDWGGFRLDEVKVPIRWWHGDKDTSCRSRTGSTWSPSCPTRSSTRYPVRATWPVWAGPRTSCAPCSSCGIATKKKPDPDRNPIPRRADDSGARGYRMSG